MSAWVVSKYHVDLLVKAALKLGTGVTPYPMRWFHDDEWRSLSPHFDHDEDVLDPSTLGQMLVSENVMSVHDRYPDTDPDAGNLPGPTDAYYMGPYVYADPIRVLSAAEVFKVIDCLEYQSCEHDAWPDSEAATFLRELRRRYTARVPGYDAAPWGFDLPAPANTKGT